MRRFYDEKLLTCKTSTKILRAQCKKHPTGKLFPKLDIKYINDLIRRMAKKKNWEPNLLWSGTHNLRHAKALAMMRKATRKIRNVGGWHSSVAEKIYAMLTRELEPM